MESNVTTIRTSCDRAWPFLKLIEKYSAYQDEATIYYDENEVPKDIEVRFAYKKILGSTKLTKMIFLRKLRKELL